MRSRAKSSKGNPLAVTSAFRQFVLDQLEELGDVIARSMFGGVGLYHRDLFFGIVAGDVLYLKVDDVTRPEYEKRGMRPFNPYPKRRGTMQYYTVPLEVLESSTELAQWARRAVAVARGNAARRTDALPTHSQAAFMDSPGEPAGSRGKRPRRRGTSGPVRRG